MKRILLPKTVTADKTNVRNLFLSLGMSNWNSTAAIPYAFMSPATTDPQMVPVVLIIKGIQNRLDIPVTGVLDDATVAAMKVIAGPRWQTLAWADLAKAALERHAIIPPFMRGGFQATDPRHHATKMDEILMPPPGSAGEKLATRGALPSMLDVKNGILGLGDVLGLPDVPGGIVTYGVAGYLLYRHFKKKKAA